MTAAREATAVRVKDRCMVNVLDLEQQGARTTGENMRKTAITAISKGGINYLIPDVVFPPIFIRAGTIIQIPLEQLSVGLKKRIFIIHFMQNNKIKYFKKQNLEFKFFH